MFKNYLKIAWRSIWKNKAFSLINIIGLSIGLSAAFVIGAIIYYDLTFDKFHPDGDRIYRIITKNTSPQGESFQRGVPVPLKEAVEQKVPGIETVALFFRAFFYSVDNNAGKESFKYPQNVIYTDHSYFDLLKYNWLAGQPEHVLDSPNEVVLTKSRASKYFPGLSPDEVLGSTLAYNDSLLVTVAGVVADFEERSDFTFQEFVSRKTAQRTDMKEQIYNDWWDGMNSGTQLFIKAGVNTSAADISNQLDLIAKEHGSPERVDDGYTKTYTLQPLADLHFPESYGVFDSTTYHANTNTLVGLSLIVVFLLVLGCINFINLNTAQASRRAKEIGIRKTLGSSRKQLIYQFLSETFIMTLAAAFSSILFSSWLFQIFSDFTPEGVGIGLLKSPVIISSMILLLLLLTLLAGFYPALVLSKFKPVPVLKNQIFPGGDKGTLRKYLIVFQFVIAQVFIIGTLFVVKQINFMINKDMGFKTESIAYIRTPFQKGYEGKAEVFANFIKSIPEIQQISRAGSPPASFGYGSRTMSRFDDDIEINANTQLLSGDKNYLDLYGIDLLAGRQPLTGSISEYVINETAMRVFEFKNPQEAVGKTLKAGNQNIPIVGVMKDFNQRSLKSRIEPMVFNLQPRNSTVHFSFQGSDTKNWPEAIKKIEKSWESIYPDEVFQLNFMDETVKQFYHQERRTSTLLKWATGLAIMISCLGLLGLVIHSTERRIKEIGIRKVLGATVAQLNMLLCKEYIILVGMAFVIAIPIAWWGANRWLQDFAFKTDLSWWIFGLSGVVMLVIALVVIIFRTTVAAKRNPVDSLQTE